MRLRLNELSITPSVFIELNEVVLEMHPSANLNLVLDQLESELTCLTRKIFEDLFSRSDLTRNYHLGSSYVDIFAERGC